MKRNFPMHETAMAETVVHPTAVIGAGVSLGLGVTIGPYAVVGDGATIGDGTTLAAHAIVCAGAVIGSGTRIHSFAVVGGDPQDLGFDPATQSGVTVGAGVTIREGVTINRATKAGGRTTIGDGVYLMANSHVGHDSHVGDRVILANNVMLAGHVEVGAAAFLGGGAGVHQFARIGEGTMVSGNASMSYDAPPHTIVAERNCLIGLNLVGLRRRGTEAAVIADLKRCFRAVFAESGDVRRNANSAIASGEVGTTAPGAGFLSFCASGKRGFARLRRRSDGGAGPS
ncbi:MAG: acyl-ACP--UDP-N-acetylglucosamine O-acyltransferase [Planctomycetes bacterium]|nr:acyl-ACP--UDP-N-acetylglucosamine O-acyltransferase [Planctomycetota bacterium]